MMLRALLGCKVHAVQAKLEKKKEMSTGTASGAGLGTSLISDGELRRQLERFGVDVGPINGSTRSLYQKKLRSLLSPSQGSVPNSARVQVGVKRQRQQRRVESDAIKKPRLVADRTVSREHSSPSNMYPDLSNLQDTPSKQITSFQINRYSGSPVPSSAQPSPPPQSFQPRFNPSKPEPLPHSLQSDPPSSAEEYSSSISPIQDSKDEEEALSILVSPPSPQSESSSDSPSFCLASSSSPNPQERSGLLRTVTKFIGSHVNQFFNKPQPRRSLDGVSPSSSSSSRRLPSSPSVRGRRKPRQESLSVENGKDGVLPLPSRSPMAAAPSLPPHQKYDWELEPSDVSLCKRPDGSLWRLGKGGFGEVFKGLRDGIDEVAIKIIRLHSCSPSTILQFKAEIDLISKLRHRNIVQFYGACVCPQSLYMVTELMDNDLFSVLRLPREAERYKWSGLYGKEVLLGVAVGLNYLHSRKPPVVHRDIKSPNILVMEGMAKIADVGVARTMGTSDMTAQRGFTVAWAAPEVVYRRRATEKIDIWSLGIIIWEVVSGKLPRPGKLVLPDSSPPLLKALYSDCVSDNPADRPSSLQVVAELRNIQ